MVDKTSVDPYGLTKLDEKQLNIIEKIISDCELELHDAILLDDEDSSEKKEDLSVRSCKTGFLPVNDELTELFGKLIQDYNLN